MTFISDQLVHLDAQLDRLQLDRLPPCPDEPTSPYSTTHAASTPSAHAQHLQKLIKALSAAPNRPLTPQRIVTLLRSATPPTPTLPPPQDPTAATKPLPTTGSDHELELEWVLVSKAAIQTYGIVLNSLLEQTLPLTQDMFYWDAVVSSPAYTALYTLQTAPSRLVAFSTEIVAEALRRLRELREMERIPVLPGPYTIEQEDVELRLEEHGEWLEAPTKGDSLSLTARKFYALVRNALHERSWRVGAVSPLALARHEIGRKRAAVKRLREMKASALGVLIGEGLSFGFEDAEQDGDEWKGIVERAVMLMENVVCNVSTVDTTLDEFEEAVFAFDKPTAAAATAARPTAALAKQLVDILTTHLPAQSSASRALIATHGRPSLTTRYWLPATALLLSSTTILRMLSARRAEFVQWLRDLGETTIDFWHNWVIEPTRQLIGTIRHSEDSEVALLSRDSLAADMHSLERMVVDFAIDNPAMATADGHGPMTDAVLESVRARVKEGDLTPVLRAYEHDLRRPFRGAVRGELVRALLIQIQKTKVDVEVAISGIDRLLKSQELVFGMVGLTPGVLVCVGAVQWARGAVGGRRGRRSWARAGEMLRVLRNVDRILVASRAMRGENAGMLSYKEHGLLLCEVHVLREFSRRVLPRGVRAEFVEDVEELVDVRRGVSGQVRVVERIRWAYAKWIR